VAQPSNLSRAWALLFARLVLGLIEKLNEAIGGNAADPGAVTAPN
jgi:hypothetical protein